MGPTDTAEMIHRDYHRESAKLRILIFGHREFSQLMSSAIPRYTEAAEFKIHDVIIGGVNEIQRQISEFRPDAIISAGANAAYLQSALTLPVVSLPITDKDAITAISKASKIGPNICYIHYGPSNPLIPLIQSHLNINIFEYLYTTPEQAREHFQILSKQQGYVYVSASLVCGLAVQQGLDAFLLYSEESCHAAIADALSRATSYRRTRVDDALVHWLLKDSKTPIIMFNQAGQSVTLNQAAKHSLQIEDGFDNGLTALFDSNNLSQSDGECRINGIDWWFHRDEINTDNQTLFVFQLYPKKQATTVASDAVNTRLVYRSDEMHDVLNQVSAFASTPSNTLIHGETGTGKELVARAIHKHSNYAKGAFIALNCSAIPSELFEGELYGHREGAFTGARRGGKKGLVEAANGGVLFLDEISELALDQQAKLLRFLQEKSFRPIGDNREIPVDLKLIAATNKDLRSLVHQGLFREDLFYRLNVFYIQLPALRDRSDDIIYIAQHIAHKLIQNFQIESHPEQIISAVAGAFLKYHWPGNVRELENVIERILVYLQQSHHVESLPSNLHRIAPEIFSYPMSSDNSSGVLKQVEKDLVLEAIARFDGDKKRAAEHLGLSHTTLWRRLKQINQK